MGHYRKAIVGAIVAGLMAVADKTGIGFDQTALSAVVDAVVVAVLVWVVPNAQDRAHG